MYQPLYLRIILLYAETDPPEPQVMQCGEMFAAAVVRMAFEAETILRMEHCRGKDAFDQPGEMGGREKSGCSATQVDLLYYRERRHESPIDPPFGQQGPDICFFYGVVPGYPFVTAAVNAQ